MLAHCVHHLRRRGSTGPPGRHPLLLHFFLFADVTEVDWDHDYMSLSLLSSREISRFSEEKKREAPKVDGGRGILFSLSFFARFTTRSIHEINREETLSQQRHTRCGASVKTGAPESAPSSPTPEFSLASGARHASGPPFNSPSLSLNHGLLRPASQPGSRFNPPKLISYTRSGELAPRHRG